MTITKVVDNASTTLYQYCSTGDYIPTLNMAVRKSGGDHLLYLQYCFRHNQITLSLGMEAQAINARKRP